MKFIRDKMVNGKMQLTYEVDPDETIIAIRSDSHYRLADPMDDVIASHILNGMRPVVWCSITQKWVD